MDREDAFPGIAPRERPEPGEAQRERLPLEEGEPPRPRQPAAAGRRRSGFGSIVVRPLDPSIRSQLLIEEGAALVVINSRYPLFLERKGDIWYQLETAAREICKTIEGVTLAEYERRVNEIMWLAFQLRQRRRRMRTGKQLQLLS